MGQPLCVILGTGRMAGGFVAPVLASAGWRLLMVGRDPSVVRAITAREAITVRRCGSPEGVRIVTGVSATTFGADAEAAIRAADMVATAVGPGALREVGRWLGVALRERMAAPNANVNILTFENHRRAPELLLEGLLESSPELAADVGRRFGIAGAAAWRAISHRRVTDEGVSYEADGIDECHVDAVPLVDGVPPADGSVPGFDLVHAFDDRIVEKLWLFNAGHVAAAYLGWLVGARTVSDAVARPVLRQAVSAVVDECQLALTARAMARGDGESPPARPRSEIVRRYADPSLDDAVTRVGREPRRKLAADDRLVAPALACQALGVRPVALGGAIAAALRYADPGDPQAVELVAEVQHEGPAETLYAVSGLHPRDELSHLICERFHVGHPLS